jgi:hypothetical protein
MLKSLTETKHVTFRIISISSTALGNPRSGAAFYI